MKKDDTAFSEKSQLHQRISGVDSRVVVDCTLRRNGGGEIGSFVENLRLEEDIFKKSEAALDRVKRRASFACVEILFDVSDLMLTKEF